ncbi:MAG: hypothetical protein OXT70_03395 [Chloroflexota bacterium]|nr:hypothetical protein [Chloroflexota bacterium]
MPTYRVIFTNGEKRDLTVKADRIDFEKKGVLRLMTAGETRNAVAVVPLDRVLYVVQVEEE